jgi:hypothetical protein
MCAIKIKLLLEYRRTPNHERLEEVKQVETALRMWTSSRSQNLHGAAAEAVFTNRIP